MQPRHWVKYADRSLGIGYTGGTALLAALLIGSLFLWHRTLGSIWTRTSRTILFWAAFVLTRPLGAVVGDFLDKPTSAGGLELSRYTASAVPRVFIAACIFLLPHRAASKSH